jgi:2,4-diketo-3-deoxy-L-fuconate hydrolase
MRLIRFGPAGAESPGAVDAQGRFRDLSGHVPDWSGDYLDPEVLRGLQGLDLGSFPEVDPGVRLGPCAGGVGKIVCIGLNYADHAAETGVTVPVEPVIFMKAVSALAGPNDDLPLPRGSLKTDWEVELAVVIGKTARYIGAQDAGAHIAGYAICNDYSERAWQIEGTGTWDKGKGCDGFGPLGPWLATPDEIADPQDLAMWLEVNGRRMQDGSTRTMVYDVPFLISYVSRFMSLRPGDIISTGTPPGVGMGQKPPWFLKVGDTVRLGIEGLGEQLQTILPST